MDSRFERFSERARKVLSLAQEEAQRFNHNYIGTEHILLGLVRETEGVAARVLANLGVDLSKVRSAVEFIIGRGERPTQGEIGLTPRAKKVVELAVDEARRMNHTYIGTEHLLISLIREGEGLGAGVLKSLYVDLDSVRNETLRILKNKIEYSLPLSAEKTILLNYLFWRTPLIIDPYSISNFISWVNKNKQNLPELSNEMEKYETEFLEEFRKQIKNDG